MPVSTPVVEMVEIGAGGGSIAHVDSMGQLRVGPQSAASEPGPACYQRGGDEPTVSDANLMLGRLDPDNFAGGAIPLSTALSEQALASKLQRQLGRQGVTARVAIEAVQKGVIVRTLEQERVAHGVGKAACQRGFANANRAFHHDVARQRAGVGAERQVDDGVGLSVQNSTLNACFLLPQQLMILPRYSIRSAHDWRQLLPLLSPPAAF